MRVEVRETDEAVILELHGPFECSDEEREEARRVASEAGGRGKKLVFVLRVERITSLELGQFLGVITSARSGEDRRLEWPVRIVAQSQQLREVFRVAGSGFVVFDTEEEALEWRPRGPIGCFAIAILALATTTSILALLLV